MEKRTTEHCIFFVALCAEIQAANITLTAVNKRVLNFSHKNEELKASVNFKTCFPIGFEDNAVLLWQNLIPDHMNSSLPGFSSSADAGYIVVIEGQN